MARTPAIQLAPGVWRIPLLGDWVNGFLFVDDDGQVTLLDTGIKRSPDKITAALRYIGLDHSDVTRILLTHAHSDHAGGVAEMSRRTGRPVDIHVDDAPYLRRGQAPPRDQSLRIGRLMNLLPTKDHDFEVAPVGEQLHDGQLLPVGGGLRVVHTPGHSPGHASYLHEPTGVLVTGDALFNARGRIGWSVPFFCTDFALSQETAQRFAELDFSTAAFTHGPHVSEAGKSYVGGFLARHATA